MKILLTGVGKGFGRSYLNTLVQSSEIELIAITRNLDDFSKDNIIIYFKKCFYVSGKLE